MELFFEPQLTFEVSKCKDSSASHLFMEKFIL